MSTVWCYLALDSLVGLKIGRKRIEFVNGKSPVTIITETDQVKTETGLVCYETDQFISKYQFVSILLVVIQVFICPIQLQIMLVTSMFMFISLPSANGSAVKRT